MNKLKIISNHPDDTYKAIALPAKLELCFEQLELSKGVCYILLDDESLLEINNSLLQHDYYTDIITLDYADDEDFSHSEVYISIDRVKENAEQYGVSFVDELNRVFIHGLLHLAGHADKTEEEKELMRAQEDHYLALLRST